MNFLDFEFVLIGQYEVHRHSLLRDFKDFARPVLGPEFYTYA